MPADVPGLYARFGVRLRPYGNAAGWSPCRCFNPAHRDRHQSCMVHLRGGTFRCFACGVRGGVLDALQLLGMHDREEARRLALDYGIDDVGRARPARRGPLPGVHRAKPTPTVENREPSVAQRAAGEQVDWNAVSPSGPDVMRRREWAYVDEHGAPVGRVVRLDLEGGRKRIWQERHEDGRFIAGMGGRTLPLYRLPEVRARAREGRRVLVVEGEKVVDALDRIGAFATTNPGGAGKWQPEYTGSLRGAPVTVVCDCDYEGRRHAYQVTQLLLSGGVDVTMPLDPSPYHFDGFDLADHLAGVAKTVRSVTPEVSRWRVRWILLDHLYGMLREVLPVEAGELRRKLERLDFDHAPQGRELRRCPACGDERPHRLVAGFAYCPCGGFHPSGKAVAQVA